MRIYRAGQRKGCPAVLFARKGDDENFVKMLKKPPSRYILLSECFTLRRNIQTIKKVNNMSNYDNNNNNGGNNQNGNGNRHGRGNGLITLILFAIIIFLFVSFFIRLTSSGTNNEIKYNEFLKMIDEDKIEKVVISTDRVIIYPKEDKQQGAMLFFGSQGGSELYTGKVEDDETLSGRLIRKGIEVSGEIPDDSGEIWYFIIAYILPIVIMVGFGIMLFRRMSKSDGIGGIMNVGKSNAKVYVQKETGISFKDVAGEDEAIESIQEVVDFLHNPEKYVKIGARLPKGALLVGPPGTGKTLLAKAVAGEAKVPFFSITGSDFVEMYVGVGASRVRDLFKEAEKNAPCIVFIDEIDAIGRSRDSKVGGGNEEREQTLNQLLAEMDGFDGKKGIIIMAATNRPEILDKALLRPGRFDRRIIVEKPDLKGRVEILKVHAKDVLMDETVNFEEIALATSGAVGSDLANMINEAAISAVKNKREYVSQQDLLQAVEIVLLGKEKKDRVLSEQEKKIVAFHEVGHALISALQKNSEPVQKISIVPRTMGALGFVSHVPEEEKYLNSKEELYDMIVGFLGGRAAEEVVFKNVTTGASDDIEKATNIARQMITRYGMSEKFGLIGLETVESQYLDKRSVLTCADTTAALVDEEVMKVLKECYAKALEMLESNRDIMDKLADYLISKETITGKEFMEIYCKEKGIPVPVSKSEEMRAKAKEEEAKKAAEKADSDDGNAPEESKDAADTVSEETSEPVISGNDAEAGNSGNDAEEETVVDAADDSADNSDSGDDGDEGKSDGSSFADELKNRLYK